MNTAGAHQLNGRQARLRELQQGATIEVALAFYDTLEPVRVEEIIGSW